MDDRFVFKIEGREIVRLTDDGEFVFGNNISATDLRSCISYLVGCVERKRSNEELKEKVIEAAVKWRKSDKETFEEPYWEREQDLRDAVDTLIQARNK
jgi:hypothetical protein